MNDKNDNMPEFEQDPIRVKIDENMNGTDIGQFTATDRDSGMNARLIYTIAYQYPLEPPNMFAINQTTGWLRTEGPIDFEAIESVLLVIKATGRPVNSHHSSNVSRPLPYTYPLCSQIKLLVIRPYMVR